MCLASSSSQVERDPGSPPDDDRMIGSDWAYLGLPLVVIRIVAHPLHLGPVALFRLFAFARGTVALDTLHQDRRIAGSQDRRQSYNSILLEPATG